MGLMGRASRTQLGMPVWCPGQPGQMQLHALRHPQQEKLEDHVRASGTAAAEA
jgi:hypothetical protein